MLSQLDIDELQMEIQKNKFANLYYIASFVETREGKADESKYKLFPSYKILKITITDISNAYFEYENFIKNPSNYTEEKEIEYQDDFSEYIHYYTIPKSEAASNGIFKTRMPSIIYGIRKEASRSDGTIKALYNEPSPVIPIYTNSIECGTLKPNEALSLFNNKKLDWKYKKLPSPVVSDGIEYKYVTSDWYIIKCSDFPRTEHILVNSNEHCAYFRDLNEAMDYKEQYEA